MSEIMNSTDTQPSAPELRYQTVAPVCDVYEDANEFLIIAEMPGVEQHAVDLRLDRTRLSIEAYRHLDEQSGRVVESKRVPTRYLRAFEVPDTIDAAQITARLEDGVLNVHLPKAPHARVRRIAVTAG